MEETVNKIMNMHRGKMNNKDVPDDAIIRQLLVENGKLKSEIEYLEYQLKVKNDAITKFKKWQADVVRYKIQYWLTDGIKLLDEPISDEAVNLMRRLCGNITLFRKSLKRLINAYESYRKVFEKTKGNQEILNLLKR